MSTRKENDITISEDVSVEAKKHLDKILRGITFMRRREADMNPDGVSKNLAREPESDKKMFPSSTWKFAKYLSNGATLSSNQASPNTLYMSATHGVYDDEHAQNLVDSARLEATHYGKNLLIHDKNPAFDNYCSIAHLNQSGFLPVSEAEMDSLIASGESLTIADEYANLYGNDEKGKASPITDAMFRIKPFMQEKDLRTEETNKSGIVFNLSNGVETLDNITYSLPKNAPHDLNIVFKGSRDTINNLKSLPIIDGVDPNNVPENTEVQFHGTPREILPDDLADMFHEEVFGKNKTLTLLLDDKSNEYRAECDYVNEIYNELMKRDANVHLVICDRQDGQEVVRKFDRYHAPGAEYDTSQPVRNFDRHFQEEERKQDQENRGPEM